MLVHRRAANAAGVGRSTAYLWRQEDPEFAAKWDEAVAEGIYRLEDEAHRGAVEGVKRPILWRGVIIDETTEYNDKLLIFFLKTRRPEVFARSHDANPPEGFARSHDAARKVDTKVLSVEGARSQIEDLGLHCLIEGDYEEHDAPRELGRSSMSGSAANAQAIVGNVTQATRDTAPERAARSLPALTDTQQTPPTIGKP